MRSMTWLLLLLVSLAPGAFADQLIATGAEIQVNSFTTGRQGFPEVAPRPGGGFVVAWEGDGDQDGDSWGVFAQMYSADGSLAGSEFQVNTTTADYQWDPSVAVDGDGNFVIVWQGYVDGTRDFDVFAQRFDATGAPAGSEFQANTFTDGFQGNTTVAAGDDGDFLIVWESEAQDQSDGGVYGQLYDAAGVAIGNEVRINDTTVADQNAARVVAVDGGYAVTWESFNQDSSEDGVVVRFLNSTAAPDGAEILVNTEVLGSQEDPAIAVNAAGVLAVVWETDDQDGAGEGIFAKVFADDGTPIGDEFQVNTFSDDDQKNPRVAADGTGGFVAVWTSQTQFDGQSDDNYGQRFDATGALVGGEFRVNTQATADQDVPNIAGGEAQQLLVVWRSFGDHDGDSAGVFAQRFEIGLFGDGFESGDTSAWTLTAQ